MAVLFLLTENLVADGQPWKPDYSTPERTVLTYCLAQNLPEGRREIMARAFQHGDAFPDTMFRQGRAMCRVVAVEPVFSENDPAVVLPDQAAVKLEEWDPVKGEAEANIFRRWFWLSRQEGEWIITAWSVAYDPDNPPDDVLVCRDQRWWGLPELSSPVAVVCNFLYDLSVTGYERLDGYFTADASRPEVLWTIDADIVSVQPAILAGNATALDLSAPDVAEVVVVGLGRGDESPYWNLHRFTVRRFGDEWRIARIEYLGRRPDPAGEGK